MYKLIISPKAQRELKKISKLHRLSIGRIIEEIKADPSFGKPLSRELTRRYSYRVDIYRIIYKINEEDRTIEIISAGHRSVVYQ